ncbi:MAG: Zn-ribbon domain-containing OB-fold protein [Chloroflexi bacterium]|nr:Zn-ribbon domain-containing OB-fold protein [Chloroflexota bacterium]
MQHQKPLPLPTPETRPFWEGAHHHTLLLPRCRDCRRFHFYPRAFCPHCLSPNLEWRQASGRGTLYAYGINHRPAPGFEADVPYVIALVELEEGPRMVTNLVDVDPEPDRLRIGLPVEVVFEDVTATITLPKFRLR